MDDLECRREAAVKRLRAKQEFKRSVGRWRETRTPGSLSTVPLAGAWLR